MGYACFYHVWWKFQEMRKNFDMVEIKKLDYGMNRGCDFPNCSEPPEFLVIGFD